MARDLHDVAATTLADQCPSGCGARPDGGRSRSRPVPRWTAIKSVSKDALDELRTMLYLLSEQDDDGPPTPRPGLDRLEELIEFDPRRLAGQDRDAGARRDPLPACGRSGCLPDHPGVTHQRGPPCPPGERHGAPHLPPRAGSTSRSVDVGSRIGRQWLHPHLRNSAAAGSPACANVPPLSEDDLDAAPSRWRIRRHRPLPAGQASSDPGPARRRPGSGARRLHVAP